MPCSTCHVNLSVRRLAALFTVAVAGLLAGCSGPSSAVTTPVQPPDEFSDSGEVALMDEWWTAFGDEGLNAAVDTALAGNFDLLAAWERLGAARATADRASSGLFPAVELSGGAERGQSADGEADWMFSAGGAASYEIDLWGRIRSAVQAEQFRAAATQSDYRAAVLTVVAEVARTWSAAAEAQLQVDLVREQVETNRQVLESLENRFSLGQIRAVDVLRQRQLLEATYEQLEAALARRAVLRNQLAVLVGRAPQSVAFSPSVLPDLPPLPDTGVPIDLIRRRPDVQSAFLRLRAADRDVASAISSQFPRLTLTASATSSADAADNLFQDWATSFAGDLLAPIFLGGELRAEVDRTQAVRRELLYAYGQTVLSALQDVEDALVLERRQQGQIERIDSQVRLARQSYRQLRVQYLNGATTYLDVLTALDEVQQLQRAQISARLTLIGHRIALYRALAGPVPAGTDTPPSS